MTILEMTLSEFHKSLRTVESSEARTLIRVATFMGNGSIEERLLRLMVFVGASLKAGPEHSKEKNPIEILKSGSAWCDQQVIVFLYMAWRLLDLPGRDIAIYHTDGKNGHTVCEVHYDGRWHLFDIHSDHQVVYRKPDGDIMSLAEVIRNSRVVEEEGHWWKGLNGEGKVGFYRGDRKPAMICGVRFE